MKTKLLLLLILLFSNQTNAINVTIIESQSGNFWARQDSVWNLAAIGIGYNPSIVPQSTLDNISNLNSTDVLIIASGTISFTGTNHLQTIKQFVLSGRPVYIQSEYQSFFQGNITFDSLMHTVGAAFNWIQTVSGSLVPMNILGTFSTTPNLVQTINYFNYGYSGTGSGVEKFLEFNGNFFGFCYTDLDKIKGSVITISDEDWAWNNASILLMENILFKLAHSITASIKDVNSNKFSLNIFPNPFSNETNIDVNIFFQDVTLTIYNSIGQQVKQINNISGSTFTFFRDNLLSGLYFIQLTQENEIIITEKLVIAGN